MDQADPLGRQDARTGSQVLTLGQGFAVDVGAAIGMNFQRVCPTTRALSDTYLPLGAAVLPQRARCYQRDSSLTLLTVARRQPSSPVFLPPDSVLLAQPDKAATTTKPAQTLIPSC